MYIKGTFCKWTPMAMNYNKETCMQEFITYVPSGPL